MQVYIYIILYLECILRMDVQMKEIVDLDAALLISRKWAQDLFDLLSTYQIE